MLLSLHVKNLALIDECQVEFGDGLNILTGETGAGKSVLIGSINLALGSKFDKDMLRQGADSASVELCFYSEDAYVKALLEEWDIPWEEGIITITRKWQLNKSISKINGESVNTRQIKELAENLIDIHGQHEHQSLLHKKKHLEILDAFGAEETMQLKDQVASIYKEWKALCASLEDEAMDEVAKQREQALLEFECNEISNANLKVGENEELENVYRKMLNGRKIAEALSEGIRYTGNDSGEGAGSGISRALRLLGSVSGYDKALEDLEGQLAEIENLLSDYNREVSSYLSDLEFDEADFRDTEDRINELNHLKDKYGRTIEAVLESLEERSNRLEQLADYDAYMADLQKKVSEKEVLLREKCKELSALRKANAAVLTEKLVKSLENLNFLSVQFEIQVREEQTITANGYDDVEFMISTNPGEAIKPLSMVASGGELSRIMLAIKTVLADKDHIDTLIFDEIDAGISGITAWKVAEELNTVGKAHQVLCITHLPQIAAMADCHYVIEKSASNQGTVTSISALEGDDNLGELARLLGSDSLSEAALENAREMRKQALSHKETNS